MLWLLGVGSSEAEIVISPAEKIKQAIPAENDRDQKLQVGTSALRSKARAYRNVDPSSGVPIMLQMDSNKKMQEGIFIPEKSTPMSRARNYEHSRAYLRHSGDAENLTQIEKNRLKASQYTNDESAQSLALPNQNQQVTCKSTGNVSGFIGDDSVSGGEIIVIRNHKQIKMRCK